LTRLLIVNADDFGLTRAVSRGILRAHREGIVTSASVLAVAPGFADSVRLLRDAPGLGVGVHLAAVGEDPPLSSPGRIPSLVGAGGRFPSDWKAFLRRAAFVREQDLEEEFAAQIESARGAGIAVDHLDAHQHLHLLPRVRRVVLRLARRFRLRAVRVPRAGLRRPAGLPVRWLARGLARAAKREGLFHPDLSEGFDDAGRMVLPALLKAIEGIARSGAASAEIFVHPGERDDPERARYAWGYDWSGELAALLHPDARAAVAKAGFRLGTYRDLPWGPR
jgi:predicted glycoside hydrolase/deacetylase ChbG (UPF0249 family)